MHNSEDFKMALNENCLRDLCDIAECLTSKLKSEVKNGVSELDTEEAFKAADIIKDMKEAIYYSFKAEKCYYEKEYYKTVIEAMEKEDADTSDRYGYNHYHTGSGRFATKGNGMRVGYRPYIDQEPYIDAYLHNPDFKDDMRMGYNGLSDTTSTTMADRLARDTEMNRYGKAYNEYRTAKKHYTQTKSTEDKDRMNSHANEHMRDLITTTREMWDDADPVMRTRMHKDLNALLEDMKI